MAQSTNQGPSKALDTVDNLILGWLVGTGCLRTFEKLPSSIAYEDDNSASLPTRSNLLRLVRSGCITDAIVVVKQIFETSGIDFGAVITFQGKQYTNSQVYFLLLAQQLIELVRLGNFPAAFKWGQDELVPFGNSHPDCNEIKAEVLGLLAYQKPLTSPVQHLLDKSRYAWLADLLNLCLLKTPDSPLDTVLRQVLALDGLVEEMGGFVEETDKKKWSALQALLSGTALTAKSSKTAISSPKLKLLKND